MNHYPAPWDKRKNPYINTPPKPWEGTPTDPWDKHSTKGAAIPKPITINDLFPSIDRWAIGWSPILETLKEISSTKATYPPYDIIDQKDDTTLINVAVAGFTKKDIQITVEEQVLKIEGSKNKKKEEGEVVYNGIAGRSFCLSFPLALYYEVESASMSDGILTLKLAKNIPDEKKPKVIDIK